jgi:hypothetical protein
MTKIDTYAQNISASVTALQTSAAFLVDSSESTTNNYVATVTGFGSYTNGKIINLSVDVTTTGTTTLNINSLGAKTICKVNSSGNSVNLVSGDLVKGRYHTFIYNTVGGVWLWIDSSSGDQINIPGNVNEIAILSGSGIASSGISASSLALVTSNYVVTSLSSNLGNESLLTAGSGVTFNNDASSSKIIIDTNIIAGSGISVSNNITASKISIINNTIAGSGISIEVNTTASNIKINNNIISGSGTSIEVDISASKLKINSNFVAGTGTSVTTDTSASSLAINTLTGVDGWTTANATWSYISASKIGITGASSILSVGDKLKYEASGSTIYQYVTSAASALVVVTGGTDYSVPNAAITNNYYSKQSSPLGFPQWFNYTPTYSAVSPMTYTSASTTVAKFSLIGKVMHVRVSATGTTGGTAAVTIFFTLPIAVLDTQQPPLATVVDGTLMGGLTYLDDTSTVGVRKYDVSNFGLGAGKIIRCNGSFEI